MKILFLTTVLPRNKRMGSEVASQCFIEGLHQNGYQVSVVGYMRKDDVFELNPKEVLVGQRYIETKKAKYYPLIWLIISFFKRLPYSSAKYYSKSYIRQLKELLNSDEYDVVIIDHPQIGWLERFLENPEKIIMTAQNIEHEIYLDSFNNASNFISKFIYRREADLIKEMEDKLATTVKQVWVLTQHDANYFSKLEGVGEVKVFDLPPGLEKFPEKPIKKDFDIGIIGSWAWKPNEEGLRWFLQSVYPHLPVHLSIHVAGRGAEWITEKYPNIHYRGFVLNAQEFLAQAKVVAIPILNGGGIQIKTLDAIASGSQIVATPVALRGIAHPPKTVHFAEQPKDFANLLVSAIASPLIQQAFDEARTWYEDRRNKFITDIACSFEMWKSQE